MNRDLGIVALPLLVPEAPPAFAEKRHHPRRQLAVRCWMGDGQHTVYARVHDVSMGGLSIRAPVAFASNVELELTLVLPVLDDSQPGGTVAVRARGRVVWVREREGGPRMGAAFTDLYAGKPALHRLIGR